MTPPDPAPPPPPPPGWPYGTSATPGEAPLSAPPVGAPGDAETAAPRRGSRARRALAGTLTAVIVAGAVTGGILAFRFIRGSADSLLTLVPSDSAAYMNINLDPSGAQKLAINGLLGKFPGLAGGQRESTINGWLDQGLKEAGLTHADVRPWLGSQLSFVFQASGFNARAGGGFPANPGASEASPPLAFLIADSDDRKAQATFDRFRRGPAANGVTWSTVTHNGVSEVVGQKSGATHGVWAIVSHTVIIGTTTKLVDEIIDTSQGKHASLESVADYNTVSAQLPSDRVETVYLDLPALLRAASGALGSAPEFAAQIKGLRGMGAATVVTSAGVTETVVEDYDRSKLTADQRASLAVPAHVNSVLGYVPTHAYGFFAYTGFQYILRGALDEFGGLLGGGLDQALQQFGVTGTQGIVNHLTGDAGFEVDALPGSAVPSGAFLFATDSNPAALSFLDTVARALCGSTEVCDPRHRTTQTYQGVTITSLPLSGADIAGVEPSWTVNNGLIILASSADEVKAMLDAHAGSGIRAAPTFKQVAGQVSTSNTSMFYVDIHAVVAAIRGVLPPDVQATFDHDVAPYVNPFKALAASSQSSGDHTSTTIFLAIG